MSEVNLNIKDSRVAIHGAAYAGVAASVIAALSAEPEAIAELEAALHRFIKRVDDQGRFASFHAGENLEARDAGLVIVDLAARVVAVESSYSMPQAEGEVQYHDGAQASDVWLPYRVPGDWLFLSSALEYEAIRDKRRAERAANPPLDVRQVLYGRAMREFIVNECVSSHHANREAFIAAEGPIASGSDETANAGDRIARASDTIANATDGIAEIHARWLMTPRADLRGQTPRQVILEKLDFIDFDLHSRELQWSLLGEGPPGLARDSYAYRWAGFGTHEYVLYYKLLRHLLAACWQRVRTDKRGDERDETRQLEGPAARVDECDKATQLEAIGGRVDVAAEVAWLEEIEAAWLDTPRSELDDRIPSFIIESERRRLPMALSAKSMVVDEDCEMCQMISEETGLGFWHLDGCNMDEGFVFSTCRTREEWEEEQRQWREFNEEFNRKWAEEHPDDVADDQL